MKTWHERIHDDNDMDTPRTPNDTCTHCGERKSGFVFGSVKREEVHICFACAKEWVDQFI